MGNKLVRGKNDLQTVCPEVAKHYSILLNGNRPIDIQGHCNRKVWWTCPKGHYYLRCPNAKVQYYEKRGIDSCPICSGQKLYIGYNDLATKYPNLISEWDFKRNKHLPSEYRYGSGYSVYWICMKCGHSYKSPIHIRTQGHKCPYCAHFKAFSGKTDLQTLYPKLAKEYDRKRNKIPPNKMLAHAHKKVWWTCSVCHRHYKTSPHRRTSKDLTGCPYCATHKGELFVENFLKKNKIEYKTQATFPDLKDKGRLRYDFLILKNNKSVCLLEYNGTQHYYPVPYFCRVGNNWHTRLNHDEMKRQYALNHNILPFEIAEQREFNPDYTKIRLTKLLHALKMT